MPYTATEPSLPFSGREPLARQHSYLAAQAASRTRGPKLQAMIDFFTTHRQCTDEGLAEGLSLPRSSVCSLRGILLQRGQVRAVGRTTGRYKHAITIWEWTE